MIKLIVADIDGVLTDGKIYIANGEEHQKTIALKDMDAITEIKANKIDFCIITGERNRFTEYIHQRIQPDYWYEGCKKKKDVLERLAAQLNLLPENICYIGDGKYDIEAMQYVGLGICPADAISTVKLIADYILASKGGDGCLAECLSIIEKYNAASNFANEIIEKSLMEHRRVLLAIKIDAELQKAIQEVIVLLCKTFRAEGQVLLCGNGGSAADAQHIATELVSRFYFDRPAMNAEALTVNASSITAIGNDYSFARVFARQVEAKGKKGDILIGISTSGNSENIVEAMKAAKEKGMKTIALIGGDSECRLAQEADIVIHVPSKITPRIQEMHIMIGHIVCEYVEEELYGNTN